LTMDSPVGLSHLSSGPSEHDRDDSSSNISEHRSHRRRKSKRHKKKKRKKKKAGNPPAVPLPNDGIASHPDRPDMEALVRGYIHESEIALSIPSIPADVLSVVLRCCAYYQFTFDAEHSAECFIVTSNRLGATLRDGAFGTIRFGEFLQSADQCIYRVTFSMPRFQAAFVGVGFVTRGFEQWSHSNFNLCESHCAYVYGNGFYRLSKEFQELNKQWGSTVSCPPFADSEIARGAFYVEVNCFTATAYISCIDRSAEDQSILFTFKLHLPEEVAIVIDAGDEAQPIVVTEQTFVYYP